MFIGDVLMIFLPKYVRTLVCVRVCGVSVNMHCDVVAITTEGVPLNTKELLTIYIFNMTLLNIFFCFYLYVVGYKWIFSLCFVCPCLLRGVRRACVVPVGLLDVGISVCARVSRACTYVCVYL